MRVLAWRERRPEIDSEIAAYQAASRRHDELRRKLVFSLDGAHGKLSKVDRKFASELIAEIAGELLRVGEGEDEELRLVYERHARRNFADEQAEDAAVIRSMFGELGLELGEDLDLSSPEKLMASLQEQVEASQKAPPSARDDGRAETSGPRGPWARVGVGPPQGARRLSAPR